MFELVDKRAVVTGASSGIGQATALALADAGANVAGISWSDPEGTEATRAGISESGREAILVDGDVGKTGTLDALADQVVEAWGGIDIWVNNAATLLVKPFLETTDDEWRSLLDVNLLGYVYGCRAAARHMAEQGGGRIVNVSSVAHLQPLAGLSAYVTAKGGVAALTTVLGIELAPFGITVTAIAPGAIDTPLNTEAWTAEVRKTYEERIAVGRIGRPEDIADAIVFLASDASRYMTGTEIIVDGGFMINGSVGHART